MFSGIVERTGEVIRREGAGERLLVRTGFAGLELGESVAVNGVCLTVTESSAEGDALFFVSPETLARTQLGALSVGSRVNLERAVSLSTRLSGHLVQGHVDGVGRIARIESRGTTEWGEAREVELSIPSELGRYCVPKGSIAVNGVSLTINEVRDTSEDCRVTVMLIPHTWEHTEFGAGGADRPVNIEADILAKHMERLCQTYLKR